jgi:hypothetical protein
VETREVTRWGDLASNSSLSLGAHFPRFSALEASPPPPHLGQSRLAPVSMAQDDRPDPEGIKILTPPPREIFAYEGRPCPACLLLGGWAAFLCLSPSTHQFL